MPLNGNAQETLNIETDPSSVQMEDANKDAGGEADIAELLVQLESVDGMAQGVENRLDNILENLDGLLASLESENGQASNHADKGDLNPVGLVRVCQLTVVRTQPCKLYGSAQTQRNYVLANTQDILLALHRCIILD